MKCKFCKQTVKHLICIALFEYFGAKAYPSAIWCPDSPDCKHHFERGKELLSSK